MAPDTTTGCNGNPIKGLQASATDLGTLTSVGATASFTACTQYFSKYSVSVSPAGVVSVPASPVVPTSPAEDMPYSTLITATAVANGTATITVRDKKGNTQSVTVTVAIPSASGIITFSQTSPYNFGTGFSDANATITESGYSGTFSITACSGTGTEPGGCVVLTTPSSSEADCSDVGAANENRLSLGIISFSPTTLSLGSHPIGTGEGALQCTATVSDTLSHSATFTITAPAQ